MAEKAELFSDAGRVALELAALKDENHRLRQEAEAKEKEATEAARQAARQLGEAQAKARASAAKQELELAQERSQGDALKLKLEGLESTFHRGCVSPRGRCGCRWRYRVPPAARAKDGGQAGPTQPLVR